MTKKHFRRYGDFAVVETWDSEAKILDYTGQDNYVTIPATLGEQLAVRKIGDEAFYKCDSLSVIHISDGITFIGDDAFAMCTNLEFIDLPDSITYIGNSAFSGCCFMLKARLPSQITELNSELFNHCVRLADIKIPQGITRIGNRVFAECHSLTTIHIPPSVSEIGRRVFECCHNLENITVDEENEYFVIGNGALIDVKGHALLGYPSGSYKRSLKVPYGVEILGAGAFAYNRHLEYIFFPDTLKTIEHSAFLKCSAIREIHIPNGTQTIDDQAFFSCRHLEKMYIPASVSSIGKDAFSDSDKLILHVEKGSYAEKYAQKNNIPFVYQQYPKWSIIKKKDCSVGIIGCVDALLEQLRFPRIIEGYQITDISDHAFSNCSDLKEAIIPEGFLAIGKYAFSNCSNLRFIHIPKSINHIEEDSFYGSPQVILLVVENSYAAKYAQMHQLPHIVYVPSRLEGVSVNKVFGVDGHLEIPDMIGDDLVTNIYRGAFSAFSCPSSLKLPNTVLELQAELFNNCLTLKRVELPARLLTIGDFAFSGSGIRDIYLPNCVEWICTGAFYGCNDLANLDIPTSVMGIGKFAFDQCPSLTLSVHRNSYAEEYAIQHGIPIKYY